MKYKITILFLILISIYSATYCKIYCSNNEITNQVKNSNILISKSQDSIVENKMLVQKKLEQLDQKVALLTKEISFYREQNKELLSVIDNYDTQYYVFLIIGFVFVGLFSFLGIFFWREKLRCKQKSEELEKIKSETEFSNSLDSSLKIENAKLNDNLISKERELTALTMQLANIQDSIVAIIDKASLDLNDTKDSKFQSLAKDIRGLLSQKDYWSEFMIKFTQIHPNFNTNIKEKYPVLSSKDISFCSLIKLNLSNKEIANLLQVSHESVITKKYLLKKKLALTADQDLFQVVNSIE